NGILTVENEKQAKARVGGRHGDKGAEAARAALALIARPPRPCHRDGRRRGPWPASRSRR
ncbi:MAG TPA: 6,7-dimethyl-8-ribityllumazine synthase, partial [Pseudolabrys sp.]